MSEPCWAKSRDWQQEQLSEQLSEQLLKQLSEQLSDAMTSRVRQATTDNGIAALHLAARQGHLEVVKVLLEFGADKDKAGNTHHKYHQIFDI